MTQLHITRGDFFHTVSNIAFTNAEFLADHIRADFAFFDDGEDLYTLGDLTPRTAAAVEWNLVIITDPISQPDADDIIVAKFFTDCSNHARQMAETYLAEHNITNRAPYMLVNKDDDEVYPL